MWNHAKALHCFIKRSNSNGFAEVLALKMPEDFFVVATMKFCFGQNASNIQISYKCGMWIHNYLIIYLYILRPVYGRTSYDIISNQGCAFEDA